MWCFLDFQIDYIPYWVAQTGQVLDRFFSYNSLLRPHLEPRRWNISCFHHLWPAPHTSQSAILLVCLSVSTFIFAFANNFVLLCFACFNVDGGGLCFAATLVHHKDSCTCMCAVLLPWCNVLFTSAGLWIHTWAPWNNTVGPYTELVLTSYHAIGGWMNSRYTSEVTEAISLASGGRWTDQWQREKNHR